MYIHIDYNSDERYDDGSLMVVARSDGEMVCPVLRMRLVVLRGEKVQEHASQPSKAELVGPAPPLVPYGYCHGHVVMIVWELLRVPLTTT